MDEDYTSKTCGRCGDINKNLGGNKFFKCNACKLECGRDVNGARNILMKNLKRKVNLVIKCSDVEHSPTFLGVWIASKFKNGICYKYTYSIG